MAEILVEDPAPAANPSPPILNFDVLMIIFTINASLHWSNRQTVQDGEWALSDPRPLIVLRRTSQVCRRWRAMILESSALWGMVIEVDLLWKRPRWRELVMERTRRSYLFVTGEVDGSSEDCSLSFSNLLDTEWDRVRRLDVAVWYGRRLKGHTWDVVLRPSPVLEVFKVLHKEYGGSLLRKRAPHPADPPIFSNIAPALLEFGIHDVPPGWIDLRAPWLSRLHTLVISSHFNATEVLVALAGLPALECLELQKVDMPVNDPLTPTSLPLLRTLTIREWAGWRDLRIPLFILKWIVPPANFTLNLLALDCNSYPDQDTHNLCTEVTRYMDSYFAWAPFAKSLTLHIRDHLFQIRARRSSHEIEVVPSHADFGFLISCQRHLASRSFISSNVKLLTVEPAFRLTTESAD